MGLHVLVAVLQPPPVWQVVGVGQVVEQPAKHCIHEKGAVSWAHMMKLSGLLHPCEQSLGPAAIPLPCNSNRRSYSYGLDPDALAGIFLVPSWQSGVVLVFRGSRND